MTRLQKIISSSLASLLLLAITTFPMCSARMQSLNTDGDLDDIGLFDEPVEGNENAEEDAILSQLEMLESEDTDDALDKDLDELFSSEGGLELAESNPPLDGTSANTETFLTPDLIQSLENEVNDLENIYRNKQKTADSLRQITAPLAVLETDNDTFKIEPESTTTPVDNSQPVFRPVESYTGEVGGIYKDGLDDYYERDYASAISKFRDILARSDAGHYADNCQYWIGESFFALGNYWQAIVEFEKVNRFQSGNKVSDAQLMVGLALLRAGNRIQATTELNSVLNFFGDAKATQKARRYLSQMERG